MTDGYNGKHIVHWCRRALKAERLLVESRDKAARYLKERDEARAALSQAPAPEGWRDISTAPKDGARVITYGGGLVGTSRWAESFGTVYDAVEAGWYSEQLDRKHEPTLWQPLPAVPKKEG